MSRCELTFFFFNDTATTEIYTLSLHDALPISRRLPRFPRARRHDGRDQPARRHPGRPGARAGREDELRRQCDVPARSEEHTSELQSRLHLVCRLLLEKKKLVLQIR